VEAIVRAHELERSAFSQQLRRGARHEQFFGVERVDGPRRIERIELDAEHRAPKLGAIDDALNAIGE
jgi:hypothetical protein